MSHREVATNASFGLPAESSSARSGADFLSKGHFENNWPVNGINFRKNSATLTIDVNRPGMASALIGEPDFEELSAHGFQPTNDAHITVLNYPSGNQILQRIKQYSEAGQGIILRDIEKLAANQDWSWQPTGEIHPFVGRDQTTLKLIALVDCPGAADFYTQLKDYLPGVEIEDYPMHVTLLKGAIGADDLPLRGAARLGFTKTLNGLDYLSVAQERKDQREIDETRRRPKMPNHVRQILFREFRIKPDNSHPVFEQELYLFEGMGESPLPLTRRTSRRAAKDFRNIDILAAAALGRRTSLVPESLENFLPGSGLPMATKLSPPERAAYFDEVMEQALASLSPPRITAERVVTGAIVQIANYFNNERLLVEADRRVTEDAIYYPIRLGVIGNIQQLSDALLRDLEPKETGVSDTPQTDSVEAESEAA